MSRVILLALSEADVRIHCARLAVGVSSIEDLLAGGVRLVCQSSAGAETMRHKLETDVIRGEVVREKVRPSKHRM
jgi:hypothetical protein